jgi:hypothetical protein
MVGGEIHRLLRGARALDRHGGLGEHGPSSAEVPDQLPGIGREVEAVVRGDPVPAERFDQPLDAAPVELESGGDDEAVVADGPAVLHHHGLPLGLEGDNAGLDPRHAVRDQGRHGPDGRLRVEHAGAHQRPAGLVVVDVGRIDHGDLQVGLARLQA